MKIINLIILATCLVCGNAVFAQESNNGKQ